MKKIIGIILAVLLFSSCQDNYSNELYYKVVYPDTTIVKVYRWTATSNARYFIREGQYTKHLYITVGDAGSLNFPIEIDAVPTEDGDIIIDKFRMYRRSYENNSIQY